MFCLNIKSFSLFSVLYFKFSSSIRPICKSSSERSLISPSYLILEEIALNNFSFWIFVNVSPFLFGKILLIMFSNILSFSLILKFPPLFLIIFFTLKKNFWAWERAWVLERVFIICWTFFHSFPYSKIPSINFWCSSSVHLPIWYWLLLLLFSFSKKIFKLILNLIILLEKLWFSLLKKLLKWNYL